jgi:SAM-dependent methyltransferase
VTELPLVASCPRCRARLGAAFRCDACGEHYPSLASVRVLLPEPSSQIEYWQRQLGLVIRRSIDTKNTLIEQVGAAPLGVAGQTRLLGLARAILEQVEDLAAVLGPALGGQLPPEGEVGLPRGALDYLSYLHRDWAWPGGPDGENESALAAVRRVAGGRALGRTLVIGAGACRLAYDLHWECGATETSALDIDPFLLVMAEAVIRGASPALTETSVNAPEVDPVSRRWTLAAPRGPLGESQFRFFLANGTEPPFADSSFDTVVTPWFIDQVPTDLPGFVNKLGRLLTPGGRWLNHGPLIYPPDKLPIAAWYSREEIFELARAAGFTLGAWESASVPCLVSPLTGRGKIETVLTFAAARS